MRKELKRWVFKIVPTLLACFVFLGMMPGPGRYAEAAAAGDTFTLPVSVTENGEKAPGEAHEVILKAEDGTEQTLEIQGSGEGGFTLTFTNVGDYYYTVRQSTGSVKGATYDDTIFYVHCQVTHGTEGLDVVAVAYTDPACSGGKSDIAFTNTYIDTTVYSPAIIDPPVMKTITGDTPAGAADFQFVLASADDSYPMPAGSTGGIRIVTITGSGSAEFGNISYTKPGTYSYICYELNGGILGYTYDTTVYTLTVEVTAENDRLSARSTYGVRGGGAAGGFQFTNTYRATGNPGGGGGGGSTPQPSATPTPASTPAPTTTVDEESANTALQTEDPGFVDDTEGDDVAEEDPFTFVDDENENTAGTQQSTPLTGDDSSIILYLILIGLALAAIAGTEAYRRKNRR